MFRRVSIAVTTCSKLLVLLDSPFLMKLRLAWPLVLVIGLALLLQTGCATLTKGTSSSMTGVPAESSMSEQQPKILSLPFTTPALAEIESYASRLWAYLPSLRSSGDLQLETPHRNKEL